jgi:hypothetical protein
MVSAEKPRVAVIGRQGLREHGRENLHMRIGSASNAASGSSVGGCNAPNVGAGGRKVSTLGKLMEVTVMQKRMRRRMRMRTHMTSLRTKSRSRELSQAWHTQVSAAWSNGSETESKSLRKKWRNRPFNARVESMRSQRR